MDEETKLAADLNAKLKHLKFIRDKTNSIMDGSSIVAMERQLKALNSEADAVDELRRKIEQSKFEKDEEPDAIAKWGGDKCN